MKKLRLAKVLSLGVIAANLTGCHRTESNSMMKSEGSFYTTPELVLQKLNSGVPFVNFPLLLSEEEKVELSKVKVNGCNKFDNFANLGEFTSGATSFFESIGNSSEFSKSIASTVYKIVNNVLTAFFKQEAAWVTIRAVSKTDMFDVPRWHTDGYYYKPFEGLQYKVALTLKGEGTLFYDMPEEERENFVKALSLEDSYSLARRGEIAKLINQNKVQKSELYAGVAFVVGNPYKSAVHSEPPIDSERIFISILPGTKEQIKELENEWNKGA